MSTLFTTAWNWIKANLLLSTGILLAVLLLFFPKVLKGLFGTRRKRVRHHRIVRTVTDISRTLPRSVGIHKIRHRSHGSVKRPWQVKGSRAAKLHMAKIRRLR